MDCAKAPFLDIGSGIPFLRHTSTRSMSFQSVSDYGRGADIGRKTHAFFLWIHYLQLIR